MTTNTSDSYFGRVATPVWFVLVAATVASWTVGVDHRFLTDNRRIATSVVLGLAFCKVQLVGTYFMELNHAPRSLRFAFSTWVVGTFLMVDGIYLFG